MFSSLAPIRAGSLWLLLAVLFQAQVGEGRVLITVDEALRSIYPDCVASKDTQYLSQAQIREAQEASGLSVPSAVVIRYQVSCPGTALRYAYTDTHRVRTHPETLLVALDAQGKIARIEVLSFDEPTEYLPKTEWYDTFKSQSLTPELSLKRAIPTVTGASLTSRATTEAARRVLAVHQALLKKPGQ